MKFIFVCGGVLSGLGKGIVCSSIGLILKSSGFDVTAVKIDPYISLDAGTMRPAEHGEVFVTKDGGELDQDLGNYERFMDIEVTRDHNITTGKVFQNVINNERSFKYGGRDAEMIPDVIDEIKNMVLKAAQGHEICVVEIGGTTGDLENQPFLYAARELGREYKSVYIIVVYLPFLKNVGELKTKPAQHAVTKLREAGIFPDFLITRNEIPIDKPRIENLAKRCFINRENIIDDPDTDCIYSVPLKFDSEKIGQKIMQKLQISPRKKDLVEWKKFVTNFKKPLKSVKIALVGKYFKHGAEHHKDVYISVVEALNHAGASLRTKVEIIALDSEKLGQALPEGIDGVLVPQGWGSRGIEGKIRAVKEARLKKIPYLGLCFGMQMAIIEFARNVCEFNKANTTEAEEKTPQPVIHIMENQKEYLESHQYGGTIRLGQWPCHLVKDTLLSKIYRGQTVVLERHRHRYEFNPKYRKPLEEKGLVVSGLSADGQLVEAIELPNHPFFLGTQFHPEYQSRPLNPHPIFLEFLKACLEG